MLRTARDGNGLPRFLAPSAVVFAIGPSRTGIFGEADPPFSNGRR